jgi:hydrogenase nickel incorporation protein HypA/HybF
MHEQSVMANLMRKLADIAQTHHARRLTVVRVKLGALSHMSPEHFQEHFARAAGGTVAEACRLEVEVLADPQDPRAQDILISSVDLEPATVDGESSVPRAEGP